VLQAGEVEGAGGVECLLRGSGGVSGEQDSVFVAVAGCGVDREAEGVSGSAVAEAEQRDLLTAGKHAGGVGEASAAGDLDALELGPVLLGVV
jgi:hypothetical protein